MRMRNCWPMAALLVAVAGCGGPDMVGPAAPLHNLHEYAPPPGLPELEQMHSEPTPPDTTDRWGGSLGSGT